MHTHIANRGGMEFAEFLIPQNRIVQRWMLYPGLFFAALAGLLLANILVSTLRSNRVQIGIYRSLGVSSRGTAKIYLLQGGFLLGTSYLLALTIVGSLTAVINQTISDNMQAILTVYRLNGWNMGLLLGLVLAVGLVSIVLPILQMSRHRPAELLREEAQ